MACMNGPENKLYVQVGAHTHAPTHIGAQTYEEKLFRTHKYVFTGGYTHAIQYTLELSLYTKVYD